MFFAHCRVNFHAIIFIMESPFPVLQIIKLLFCFTLYRNLNTENEFLIKSFKNTHVVFMLPIKLFNAKF